MILPCLVGACGLATPPYAERPQALLAAVQAGELTSIDDLRGLSAFSSGSAKRFGISFQAKDTDFEFPAAAVIGKIVRFKLLTDEPLDYKLDGQKGDGENICSAMEQIAASNATKSAKDSLGIDESRYLNFRKRSDGNCTWDEVRGMRHLTYSLETTVDFFKISFIVGRDSIWMIDLHK